MSDQKIARLDAALPDFPEAFDRLLITPSEADSDLAGVVAGIITEVATEGDSAVVRFTNRFDDRNVAGMESLQLRDEDVEHAWASIDDGVRHALIHAADRIRDFHERQLAHSWDYEDPEGNLLGQRVSALDRVGIYVPGGRASYPSSVLMNAIPAKVAGVERLVVVTPTPQGKTNPLVLAAAHMAGVDEIWRVGGAQAVAALAYGTDRIAKVDVITGPGNAWVAEAKRQLFGVVGIDMVAGPSEILVIADKHNSADWIAADLLSQAEHDPTSQSILITDDAGFADTVSAQVDAQLVELATCETATASWNANGAIIIVDNVADAAPLADQLAAEHVELAVADPEPLLKAIRHAGSVFLGRMTPEAIGDYVAGPNHVLPTGRRARFASGLSVLDFMKRTSFIALDDASLGRIGPAAVSLAHAEGLPAHAKSVELRLK